MGKGGGKYFPRQSEKPNEDWVIFSCRDKFYVKRGFHATRYKTSDKL